MQMPVQYIGPHYNTRIFKAYYIYLRNRYGKEFVEELFQDLKTPLEYILDDSNWVSNEFTNDFMRKIHERINDPLIAEKAGLFLTTPEVMNPIEYTILRSILSPYLFFKFAPREFSKFNRYSSYEILKLKKGSCTIQLVPKNGIPPIQDVCLNIAGGITSIKTLLNLDSINVVHTECIHKGANRCVYVIDYEGKAFLKKRALQILLFTISSILNLMPQFVQSYLATFFAALFLMVIARYYKIINYVTQYFENSNRLVSRLNEEQMLFNSERSKHEFAREIVHDIRSPLTALKAALQIEVASEEKEKLLEMVQKRLQGITEKLLVTNERKGVNTINFEKILSELILETELLLKSTSNKIIKFTTKIKSTESSLEINEVEIVRILSNLINNSIDSIEKIGNVEIQATHNAESIIIKVIDDGRGISQDILTRIENEGGTFNKVDGQGPGLRHAKNYLTTIGGGLKMESTLGKGTVVTVLI